MIFSDVFSDVVEFFDEPRCYWDFPSSVIAFGESLKNSSLLSISTPTGYIFFRQGKTQLKLITHFCEEFDLIETIVKLKNKGFSIKSLPFYGKEINNSLLVRAKTEYFTNKNWSIEEVKRNCSKNERKQINHAFNRCKNKYYIEENLKLKETLELVNKWIEEAEKRLNFKTGKPTHLMVRKGHHIKYIERYFKNSNNVILFGLRRRSDDTLFGISGFELFKGSAQFTIFKHLLGDHPFPKYMRILALQKAVELIDENGKIYSGSSSDKSKSSLGLFPLKTYKIDCRKIGN